MSVVCLYSERKPGSSRTCRLQEPEQAGTNEGGSVKGGWAGRIIAWHCGSERTKKVTLPGCASKRKQQEQ